MIPVQGVENQTIAVLGLGRSGRATAAALAELAAQPDRTAKALAAFRGIPGDRASWEPLARLIAMTPKVASSDHRLVWLDLKPR